MTFRVDPVEPASQPPVTRALREALGEVAAFGGDGEMRVIDSGGVHPLLAAVHAAFSEHRPLALSPDAVWLTIAEGVAQHVRLNSEALRPRLVRHAGRELVEIRRSTPFSGNPVWLRSVIAEFRQALAQRIGDGQARLLTCDFSTTTDVERAASEIVLLDVYGHYYDLALVCVCGIPEITLTGEPRDWRAIRARIDVIAELDLEGWAASLRPIADRLVAASEGNPDVEFFRSIYKPRKAYGWDRITGWIARLYPYVASSGRYDIKNPLLELPIDWHAEGGANEWYGGPGICSSDVPARPASCLIRVRNLDEEPFDLVLQGGLMAVELDAQQRLQPRAAWTAGRSEASMGSVIDELLRSAEVVPRASALTRAEASFDLPAELVALYEAFSEARFFGWRLRPITEIEAVDVPLHGGSTARVNRFLDLPDGTCLAFDQGRGGLFVARLRVDALTPEPPQAIRVLPARCRSAQRAEAVPIVARSVAALLQRALRARGEAELPALGSLLEALPDWQRGPPAPAPRPKRR